MICPHCESPATTKRQGQTSLGSRRFRCQACRRHFNERTAPPFNDRQDPTDIVRLAVRWRLTKQMVGERRRIGGSGGGPVSS